MTIEQANEYFSSLPEGFAPAEELRAALTADVQKVQFVGVAGTAGKTAAAGLLAAILREAAFHVGFYRAGCEPLSARIAIGGVSVDPVLLCQAAEALNAAKPLPREAAELAAAARCFGAAEKRTAIQKKLREEKMKKEVIDVTLPGKKVAVGHRHPNQIALDDLERVFIGMGYEVVEGPEVEYDHYNFELLNIPANHPAKDEQDTFYITKDILLRTQHLHRGWWFHRK